MFGEVRVEYAHSRSIVPERVVVRGPRGEEVEVPCVIGVRREWKLGEVPTVELVLRACLVEHRPEVVADPVAETAGARLVPHMFEPCAPAFEKPGELYVDRLCSRCGLGWRHPIHAPMAVGWARSRAREEAGG